MYICHRIPDYATSCISILIIIHYIVITLLSRSKTVGFFPIAAFCPTIRSQNMCSIPCPSDTYVNVHIGNKKYTICHILHSTGCERKSGDTCRITALFHDCEEFGITIIISSVVLDNRIRYTIVMPHSFSHFCLQIIATLPLRRLILCFSR